MARTIEARLQDLLVGEGSTHKVRGILRPYRPGARKHTFLRQTKLPDGTTRLSIVKVPRDAVVYRDENGRDVTLIDRSLDLSRHSKEMMIQGKVDTVFVPPKRHHLWFDKGSEGIGKVEEWEFAGIDLDLASSTKQGFNSRVYQRALKDAILKTLLLYRIHKVAIDPGLSNITIVPTEKFTIKKLDPGTRRIDEGIPMGSGKNGISYVDSDHEQVTYSPPEEVAKINIGVASWLSQRILRQVLVKDIAFNENDNFTRKMNSFANKTAIEVFGKKLGNEIAAFSRKYPDETDLEQLGVTIHLD